MLSLIPGQHSLSTISNLFPRIDPLVMGVGRYPTSLALKSERRTLSGTSDFVEVGVTYWTATAFLSFSPP